jgi:diphthamide biosynthesis protein 3
MSSINSSKHGPQLDFEDEPPDDEDEVHPEEGEEDSGSESESDDDHFEDALDRLSLHEESRPAMVAVSA